MILTLSTSTSVEVTDGKRLERVRQDLTVVPIPGIREPARLAQNLTTLEITVTDDALARPIAEHVAGDHHPDTRI